MYGGERAGQLGDSASLVSMTDTVAFLGPAGTFTEAALLKFAQAGAFGSTGEFDPLPVSSPSEAFHAVRSAKARYACVAVENSVDGAVTATYDAFVEGAAVQIYREVELAVEFSIMVRPGTSAENIQKIATHPVAFQQIRKWLQAHLPAVEFVPATSNAAAAEMVADGEVDAAAAPQRAAELYGLEELASEVADVRGASTRFVLVGEPGPPLPATGQDCTSVIFTLPNEPGSLVNALQEFAYRGVDMSRIESRPTRQKIGSYRFHVDLVGHIDDAPLAEALRALWLRCEQLTFGGSWPAQRPTGQGPRDLERLREADAWVARARQGK